MDENKLSLTDEELRLIISSLDKRVKRLWKLRDEGNELTKANCTEAYRKLSELHWKLRLMRKNAQATRT